MGTVYTDCTIFIMTEYKNIPTVPSRKLIGHLKEYVSDPIMFLAKNHARYGDTFRFRLAHRYLIVMRNPDHIKQLMQEHHSIYRKSVAYRKLNVLLGNGLFTTDGSFWLKQRRLIQPAFHREKLAYYFQSIQDFSNELKDSWYDKKEINIAEEMTAVTLRIISKALLEIDLKKDDNSVIEDNLPFALDFMIKRITSTINVPLFLPLKKHKRFRSSVSHIENLIQSIIHEKRTSGIYKNDLLSSLMQVKDADTGEVMSDKQLRDEILTIFLAGHETTAMTMSWMFYYICLYPHIQQKIRDEIFGICGKESILPNQLNQCVYIKRVVQETLRMMTPIWILGREALSQDVIDNIKICKGDSIIFSPYLIHRHENYWSDPTNFNPDRKEFEEGYDLHKFAYMPFGGGPRLCVGSNFAMMEIQILIITLLQTFKFELKDKTFPGLNQSLTLRPKNTIEIAISKVE